MITRKEGIVLPHAPKTTAGNKEKQKLELKMEKEVKHRSMFATGLAVALAVTATGCQSSKNNSEQASSKPQKPGKLVLLSDRGNIPAPYANPQLARPHTKPADAIMPQVTINRDSQPELPGISGSEEPVFVASENVAPVAQTAQPQIVTPDNQAQTTGPDFATPENLSPKPQPAKPAQPKRTYKVINGDTLSGIAYRFNIPWRDLAAENNLTDKSILKVNQVLVLPENAAPTPRAAQTKKAVSKTASSAKTQTQTSAKEKIPADGYYTIQNGDSLWTITHRFGLKSSDVRALNPNIDFDNNLLVNTRIRLSGTVTKTNAVKIEPEKKPVPKPPKAIEAPVNNNTPKHPAQNDVPDVPQVPAVPEVPQVPTAPATAPAAQPAAPAVTIPELPKVDDIPAAAPVAPAPQGQPALPPLP